MHLFDPSRGAKAYSYFGTIVKRWLILYNTKNYNKKIKTVPVDALMGENTKGRSIIIREILKLNQI